MALPNPSAYFASNEVSGNLVDAISGNNLTINNAVGVTTGIISGGRQYDAASSRFFTLASAPAALNISTTADWSWAGWVYVDSRTTSRVLWSNLEPSTVSTFQWDIYVRDSDGKLSVDLYTNAGGVGASVVSTTALSNGAWYFVAVVFTNSDQKVRVSVNNGTQDASGAYSGTMGSGAFVGCGAYYNGTFPHNGRLDEISVWAGYALTSQDLTDLYNGGAANQYPFTPISQSNVSYWKMDEASGTRADVYRLNDLTDNNTVASGTGIINADGVYVSANSEYLNTTSAIVTTGTFSVSLWFNPTGAIGTKALFYSVNGGNTTDGLVVTTVAGANNVLGTAASNSASSSRDSGGTTVTAGNWYHLVITKSAGQVNKVYLNGSDTATATSAFLTLGNNGTTIGTDFVVGGFLIGWDGGIDEVGVWSRELAGSEVTSLYNAGAALAWPFTVVVPSTGGRNLITSARTVVPTSRNLITTPRNLITSPRINV